MEKKTTISETNIRKCWITKTETTGTFQLHAKKCNFCAILTYYCDLEDSWIRKLEESDDNDELYDPTSFQVIIHEK
jgi:hypothetical protein